MSWGNPVAVFDSDGPLPLKAWGTWAQNDDMSRFAMQITRTFGTGTEGRDMGEFTYEVTRSYEGTLTRMGKVLGVDGSMHLVDDFFGLAAFQFGLDGTYCCIEEAT